ncbi:hypothetical protein C798_25330 [Herbaspirillum rubrisubalbicans Os34]|uniref:Uncharacterized protein n=2 Tax=Herbaspirillum rubrisubalbicans TaxID=80842 RepID=A0A6M3ZY04_9BURK|nr:hypothetical protein C798_25330 [Herbaspirillum rubrisubalbicans Os34]
MFEWGPSKVLAVLVVGAAIAMHLAGHISHDKYLRFFGLDPSVFPRDTFGTQVIGYYVFSDFLSVGFEVLIKNLHKLTVISLATTAYFVCFYFFMESAWVKRSQERAKGKKGGWRFVLYAFAMTMMFVVGLPVMFAAGAVVTAIPSELATAYAKRRYQNDMKHFLDGCKSDKQELDYRCSEVKLDGKVIAKGFLIDSSSTHLAIFDADAQQGRVFERDKTEIVGTQSKSGKATSTAPQTPASTGTENSK